jgi:hypothetical protein
MNKKLFFVEKSIKQRIDQIKNKKKKIEKGGTENLVPGDHLL